MSGVTLELADATRCVVFDLDDTLAPSKQLISQRTAGLLTRLLERVEVSIISGARIEQFERQVLTQISSGYANLDRLHIMPTCGTRYYRYLDGQWRQRYTEDLSAKEKERIVAAMTGCAAELGLVEATTWGEVIEDRESQLTFSALGQTAPIGAKSAWDPDGSKKERLRTCVAARIPDLEVRSGGSTSIDVTRKGIDKAYGIGKLVDALGLSLDQFLFIGDRLDPGGNDYPVRALGVPCLQVADHLETDVLIQQLLDLF